MFDSTDASSVQGIGEMLQIREHESGSLRWWLDYCMMEDILIDGRFDECRSEVAVGIASSLEDALEDGK